jgi:hypothetical protein
MARKHNTNKEGNEWSESQKKVVWIKASQIDGFDSDKWRRDKCGHAISYFEHGNRNSIYGWEIDHINPVANNGGDEINNLQPLYWESNLKKSDSLNWRCG